MSMALSGPAWFDEKGGPADLSGGMWSFLTKMCDRLPDTDLGRCVRGTGSSGGGGVGGNGGSRGLTWAPDPTEPPAPTKAPLLGLR